MVGGSCVCCLDSSPSRQSLTGGVMFRELTEQNINEASAIELAAMVLVYVFKYKALERDEVLAITDEGEHHTSDVTFFVSGEDMSDVNNNESVFVLPNIHGYEWVSYRYRVFDYRDNSDGMAIGSLIAKGHRMALDFEEEIVTMPINNDWIEECFGRWNNGSSWISAVMRAVLKAQIVISELEDEIEE